MTGGAAAAAVVLLLTAVQISPLKIDPWKWLFRQIGQALCGDLSIKLDRQAAEIACLREELQELSDRYDSKTACAERARILRFNDELLLSQRHSKEHFDQLLLDITDYENYCASHPGFRNGVADGAVHNIKETYHTCMKQHSFI